MTRAYLVVAAMVILLLPQLPARSDDGQDKPAEAKPGATAAQRPAPEPLKGVMRDALKLAQSEADKAAKAERSLQMPDPSAFAMQFSKDLHADVVRAVGLAQARLATCPRPERPGNRPSMRSPRSRLSRLQPNRATVLIQIAEAQFEAGDKDEARFTLRQASQSVRSIKAESGFAFALPAPPGMDFASDSLAKKSDLLRRIAQVHARMGEKEASDNASRQAAETAESIANPRNKIRAPGLAQHGRGEAISPLWNKALDLAMQMKDEYARSKAVEVVIRARIKADQVDKALATIADRLKGDAQYYMIWVVADAIASSDHPVEPRVMDRLSQTRDEGGVRSSLQEDQGLSAHRRGAGSALATTTARIGQPVRPSRQ